MTIARPPLCSERLSLRRFCIEDLEDLVLLESDQSVIKSTGIRKVQSREQTKERLVKNIDSQKVLKKLHFQEAQSSKERTLFIR